MSFHKYLKEQRPPNEKDFMGERMKEKPTDLEGPVMMTKERGKEPDLPD